MTKYAKIRLSVGFVLLLFSLVPPVWFYYKVSSLYKGDSVIPNLIIYCFSKILEFNIRGCLMVFFTFMFFIVGASMIFHALIQNKSKQLN